MTIKKVKEPAVSGFKPEESEKNTKEPPFVKMYLNDVALLYDLPKKSGNVLYSLIKRLSYDGVIVLSPTIKRNIAKECNIIPQSLNNAIQALVNRQILSRIGMGELMPDPQIFSRGPWANVMNKKEKFEEIKMELTYSEKGGREIKVTTETIAKTNTKKPKKGKNVTQTTKGFDNFWSEYPKKVKKKDAMRIWHRLGLEDNANYIIGQLKAHKAQASWLDHEFIPQPTTWLNGERWDDEIEQSGLTFAGNTPKYGEEHKPSYQQQPVKQQKQGPKSFEQQRKERVEDTADSWLQGKRRDAEKEVNVVQINQGALN